MPMHIELVFGVNYKQIPVNRPKCEVNSYSKGGAMRIFNVSDPVYAPNSKDGFKPDSEKYPEDTIWSANGIFVRAAYTKRKDDDDFSQAGDLVRKVMNEKERERLVKNVVGHLKGGVSEPVLNRAIDYWKRIDRTIGERIEKGVCKH